MEDLGSVIPGWDSVKKQVHDQWQKFSGLKPQLARSQDRVKRMQQLIASYPSNPKIQSHKASIAKLADAQKSHTAAFADSYAKLQGLISQLGLSGLGDLGIIPFIPIAAAVAIVAVAARIYMNAKAHVAEVETKNQMLTAVAQGEIPLEKAREILGDQPQTGFFDGVKKWLILGAAAVLLFPVVQKRLGG